jgi:hypothetical protein
LTPLSLFTSAWPAAAVAEMERRPDIAAFATPLAQPGGMCVRIKWSGGRVELRARLHSGPISRAARLPKDQKGTEKIGGLVLRKPTYRAKGRQALRKGREFVRAFNALTEGSPWTLRQEVDLVSDRNKTSPNGAGDGARQDRGGHLVAISVPREGDKERVPTPCVVLFAPGGRLPRNEQPVTNEGGLIRFGLGPSNAREVRAK